MDELFKNKTKCTQKEYDEFMKVQEQEGAVSNLLYTFFNFAFFTMCFVLAIINKEYIPSVLLFLGLVIYGWYKFIRPKKQIEKNTRKLEHEYINTYTFHKRYFTTENPDGKAETLYFKIFKVIETNTHFYIYISKEYAFIVDKDGFINSNSEEFKKFIQNKVKMKYKVKTA